MGTVVRIVCAGSRHGIAPTLVEAVIHALPPETVMCEGGAPGVDTQVQRAAQRRGLAVETYPADWTRWGRAAGPRRNAAMLREGRPDCVLIFHADLAQSRGSLDLLRRALQAQIPSAVLTGQRAVWAGRCPRHQNWFCDEGLPTCRGAVLRWPCGCMAEWDAEGLEWHSRSFEESTRAPWPSDTPAPQWIWTPT